MISNYFKIAWRNMKRHKMSSFINISGLSIGLASVLLIILFIQNEFAFDKFHKDADRIYQVVLNGTQNEQEFWAGNTPPPVGSALMRNFPEVESFSRFHKAQDLVVRYELEGGTIRSFTEKKILAVDSNFLQFFDFDMLEGDPSTALLSPGSLVITEAIAKKYFGKERAMGKVLLMNQDKKPFKVTAVLKDIPSQSSLQFDFLAPVADFPAVKQFSWSWVWQQMICFVKLREHVNRDPASLKQLEAKFPAMVKVEAASAFRRIGKPFDEFVAKGGKWDLLLLPLTDIHLRASKISIPHLSHLSNIRYVYIFGSIALFILILACVNFMNLSTAQSAKRAKEVGIRKVCGSGRGQLVRQFLAEAYLFSFISALLAIIIVVGVLKPFSLIAGNPIDWSLVFSAGNLSVLLLLTVFIGLLAGIYPAFYLTSFNPIQVLKGKGLTRSVRGDLKLRNGLVVFQFTISTILIICTLVVYKQLVFFRSADMGFSRENVLVINNTNRLGKSEESFRETISQLHGINNASITTSLPSGFLFGDGYLPAAGNGEEPGKEISLASFIVDYDFIPGLEIEILQGRNFSREFSDSLSVILNEEALKQIGWTDALGKTIQYPGGNNEKYTVIGVVRNFNIESLHSPVMPFALFHASSNSYALGVSHTMAKIKSGEVSEVVKNIEAKWKGFFPGEPFDYAFLDTSFEALYRSEKRMGTIFTLFAGLSIFIACLGLFGLSAYIAEKRVKEIGVRKILGASVHGLVGLLSKDFLKLTLLAACIAFPIAWWAMSKWLEDFAYRISIGWSSFAIACLATLIISIATISFQSIKAAIANPVKSLRSE